MKKYRFVIILLILFTSPIIAYNALANSAEPPALIIIVNNPPEDLEVVMISNEKQPKATQRKIAWEGYYVFYNRDMQTNQEYVFSVTANNTSFKCSFNEPISRYNEILTLDISKQELVKGEYPFRSIILVALRVFLTLIIEGFIFYIFGYRNKNSWMVFIAINLITQGLLNIWLNIESTPLPSYLIVLLIIGEFFVFIGEMITLPIFIKEHTKLRAVIFAFIANMVSLFLGGFMISLLPV